MARRDTARRSTIRIQDSMCTNICMMCVGQCVSSGKWIYRAQTLEHILQHRRKGKRILFCRMCSKLIWILKFSIMFAFCSFIALNGLACTRETREYGMFRQMPKSCNLPVHIIISAYVIAMLCVYIVATFHSKFLNFWHILWGEAVWVCVCVATSN